MSIDPKALEAARSFLEWPEDGNAAEFVTMGDLKRICRALLAGEGPGWAEAIEAAAKVADEWSAHCLTDSIHGDPHGRAEAHVAAVIAGNIRELAALHPSVAEPDKEKI